MFTTQGSGSLPELIAAMPRRDGTHTATRLSKLVQTGRALRVRRGVYIRPQAWLEGKPWQRYRIAVAATALASDPIFCRETALLLHQVPLVRIPGTVRARTTRSGGSGHVAVPSLTGQLSTGQFLELYERQHHATAAPGVHRMRNTRTQLLHPPRLAGLSRTSMMEGLRDGSLPLHEVSLESNSAMGVKGPARYRVEPLELALVDTVGTMPFDEAVVALDWIKAQRSLDVEPWCEYFASGATQRRWQRAWEFASPHSESVGESRSRALMDELGFAAPGLQQTISTDRSTYRVDFCWNDDGVIGEFDGRVKYVDDAVLNGRDPREVLFEEKQREDALRRAGWIVVRWTWADLENPARFAALLQQAGVSLLR